MRNYHIPIPEATTRCALWQKPVSESVFSQLLQIVTFNAKCENKLSKKKEDEKKNLNVEVVKKFKTHMKILVEVQQTRNHFHVFNLKYIIISPSIRI